MKLIFEDACIAYNYLTDKKYINQIGNPYAVFFLCSVWIFFFFMKMLKTVRNLEPLHRDLLVALAPRRTL